MKLLSIKYDKNDESWHSPIEIPDNPRSILIYTEDGGTAEASYSATKDIWIQFRWSCEVHPIAWREMPRYDSNNNLR